MDPQIFQERVQRTRKYISVEVNLMQIKWPGILQFSQIMTDRGETRFSVFRHLPWKWRTKICITAKLRKRQRKTNHFSSTPRQQQVLSFSLPPTPSSFTLGLGSVMFPTNHYCLLNDSRCLRSCILLNESLLH